jgi:hypothetical protein
MWILALEMPETAAQALSQNRKHKLADSVCERYAREFSSRLNTQESYRTRLCALLHVRLLLRLFCLRVSCVLSRLLSSLLQC